MAGKAAIITGGDSGIGRAVAIAFAREGADVLIAYLDEDEDAIDTARWVERAGRTAVLVRGDIGEPAQCATVVNEAVGQFGRIDILVNNAARQQCFVSIEDICDEDWEATFKTNVHAMFYLVRAALPHMKAGSGIINTASVNADLPNPNMLPYAASKAAVRNFTGGLAQLLAPRGIRVNCVAPGPVWTPLVSSTVGPEKLNDFGANYPMGRPAQPRELAPVFVMLATDEASYVSGAVVGVTGGLPVR